MMSWLNCQNIINIVLILVILILSGTIVYNRFFKNKESMEDGNQITAINIEKLKKAKPKLYKSNNCGYCRKLSDLLHKNGVHDLFEIVDIDTAGGKSEFAVLGEAGVPVVLAHNGKKAVGYIDDINLLVEKITA